MAQVGVKGLTLVIYNCTTDYTWAYSRIPREWKWVKKNWEWDGQEWELNRWEWEGGNVDVGNHSRTCSSRHESGESINHIPCHCLASFEKQFRLPVVESTAPIIRRQFTSINVHRCSRKYDISSPECSTVTLKTDSWSDTATSHSVSRCPSRRPATWLSRCYRSAAERLIRTGIRQLPVPVGRQASIEETGNSPSSFQLPLPVLLRCMMYLSTSSPWDAHNLCRWRRKCSAVYSWTASVDKLYKCTLQGQHAAPLDRLSLRSYSASLSLFLPSTAMRNSVR